MTRTKERRKTLIIFLLVFLTTAVAVSQTKVTQGEPSQELREVARETTQMWSRELALSQKQADLMESKIIAFEMRKEALINSKMREEVKTRKLKALQLDEQKEMRDILTEVQYNKYITLTRERIKAFQQSRNQ